MAKDPEAWSSIFSMFGICVVMWTMRTVLEGMGGVGGYTDQRFFAARTEREASLLTMEAVILSIFRWGMVAGLVVMGLQVVQNDMVGAELIREDAEQVLPVVLGQLLPAGIRGLVLAGLIAAAMSTFDSTLNAGASYIVKDVYQSYVKPKADGEDLMRVSRWATIGLCVGGVLLAAIVPNINKVWGLITMGLGAGLFVPLFLRWYWPGFTGYGFAVGTASGILAALVFDAALGWPMYMAFPTIIGCALVGSVGTSLFTPRASDDVLVRFWEQINPWGMWGEIASKARSRGNLSEEDLRDRQWERLNDGIALFFSISFQFSILLSAMSFVFHDWNKFGFFAAAAVISTGGLYFFWYRNLKSTEQCLEEDAMYDELAAEGDGDNDDAPRQTPTAPEDGLQETAP